MFGQFIKKNGHLHTLRGVYINFYKPDWVWHLGLVSVVAGTLFLYSRLPKVIKEVALLAFDKSPLPQLMLEGLQLAFVIVGVLFLSAAQRTLLRYVLRTRVLNRAQPILLKHATDLPTSYYEAHSPGDLLSVMTTISVSAVEGVMGLVEPALGAIQSLFLIFLMGSISLPLTLVILGLLAVYLLILQQLRKRQARLFEQMIKSGRTLSSIVSDTHQGFMEIKQNAFEQHFTKYFSSASCAHWKNFSTWFKALLVSDNVSEYIGVLLPASMLFTVVLLTPEEPFDKAPFVSLYTLAVILAGLLNSINQLGFSSATGIQAWKEVMQLFEETPEANTGDTPKGSGIQWENISKNLRGKVILDGVNLSIANTEKVIICGRSGEGKSTLLKMLVGMSVPDSGVASVGGVPINKANPKSLRKQIAFVTQEPYLFDTTLRENLCYGLTINDRDLDQALSRAQLTDFVRALPKGLETNLGPEGVDISGGEQARISLARAFLANANILILDEATASLDSKTEESIYHHLLSMKQTVIGVTHRLSTLKLFPRVIVVADGKIVLDGPTDEVISSPVFTRLFAYQMNDKVST